jgi:peptidyl-prolyl isomerase G (cyclophilin G)
MSVHVGVSSSSSRPDSATAALPQKDKDDDNDANVCFLRVSVAGSPAETIVIRLFQKECPKTCHNFRALCNDNGQTKNPPPTTSRTQPYPIYRGCEFHRIMEGFMVQAGDFERFDGTGGYSPISSAGGGSFPDESFVIGHDAAGIVSMANSGKNTNKSQFFITLKASPHLNGKHVAFGQVIQGMNVVHQMVSVERNMETGRPVPMQRILITDCGTGWFKSDHDNENNRKEKKQKKLNKDEKKKSKKQKRKRHSHVSDSESDKPSHRKRSRKTRSRRDDPEKDDDDDEEYQSSSVSFREQDDKGELRRHKTSRRKRSHHESNGRKDSSSRPYSDDDDEASLSKDSDDSSSSRRHSKKERKRKHDGKKRKHKSRR